MRKRILTLLTGLLTGVTALVQAQNNDDFEIVFTDDLGKLEYIELPEAMTQEVDSLLALYHSRTYLEMDTLCTSNDINPEYSDEVYIDRLQRMPTVMEMPYNKIVRQFIDRYCSRLRRTVSVMLGRSNFYMPIFEQALESYNLPLELKYLPVIESASTPRPCRAWAPPDCGSLCSPPASNTDCASTPSSTTAATPSAPRMPQHSI